MQVNRLKSRARVRRMLYLRHAPECVHAIHAGKHRATADPEVHARLRTARHTALGYHCAHVFRVAREERARHHLSPARMTPEPESELPLSNSSPTGHVWLSLAGRSACPAVHSNSEAPEVPTGTNLPAPLTRRLYEWGTEPAFFMPLRRGPQRRCPPAALSS